jgi:hypothetical protein
MKGIKDVDFRLRAGDGRTRGEPGDEFELVVPVTSRGDTVTGVRGGGCVELRLARQVPVACGKHAHDSQRHTIDCESATQDFGVGVKLVVPEVVGENRHVALRCQHLLVVEGAPHQKLNP